MFERILVYLDDSKIGNSILPLVSELAGRFNSHVVLLNVIDVPGFVAGSTALELEETKATRFQEQEESGDYLECVARSLEEKGLYVEIVTIQGPVEESILTYVQQFQIDLIALVTHSQSTIARFVLKDTTGLVIRKSGIPVITLCPSKAIN
jgi:nucleotide-binding universal stress UspA family protein